MPIYNGPIKLLKKEYLTDTTIRFEYKVPADFAFVPGQFVNIVVKQNPPLRRSYSILGIKDSVMELLINIIPGGPGSIYFRDTNIGDDASMLGPLGIFKYKDTPLEKIFIATGTGIVPFIPMIKDIRAKNSEIKIQLYFGTRFLKEDYAKEYIKDFLNDPHFSYHACISNAAESDVCEKGRVTEIVPQHITDFSNKEFYICGVNVMIADIEKLLLEKGVARENIVYEKYG